MAREKKQVALVVGASRGIGRQIAIGLSSAGYSIIVAAKSSSDASTTVPFPPDPNSQQSTINTVAREITEAGGDATPVVVDVRRYDDIEKMVQKAIEVYGHLDVLIYNSGAIWWAEVEQTPMKRFQLMQKVNPEGLYGTVQACLPHFRANHWKGRIIVVSPPIYSRFFRGKTAYAMGKVGMSVLTQGLAVDFQRQGHSEMAITSIWPAAAIDSAATKDPNIRHELRKPIIFSDAIIGMLKAPASAVNGRLELDEDFLRQHYNITDFSKYSLVPGSSPRRIMPRVLPDLCVPEQEDDGPRRMDSSKLRPKL